MGVYIDLWGSVKYTHDGTPPTPVKTSMTGTRGTKMEMWTVNIRIRSR